MVEHHIEMLRAYAEGCDLFVSLLLDLPDEGLISQIAQIGSVPDGGLATCSSKDAAWDGHVAAQENDLVDDEDVDKGVRLLAAYGESCKDREPHEILQEISVDRARLFCGLTKNGPRPPYESLYMGTVMNETALSVVAAYRAGDCSVASTVKDAPDHLGVEMSYLSELCVRAAVALEQGIESVACEAVDAASTFMRDHLGLWAASFADEMLAHATTDFYRGIALMLKSFIAEGKVLLSRKGLAASQESVCWV